jgi:[ribosomal protein S5]-alanine N-acetyltransferase
MNPPATSAAASPVILQTERLLLRPFRRQDIPALLPLIGAREVAATTLRIPHPYTPEDAEKYLEYTAGVWERGEGARFGVFLRDGERLCGGIGLHASREHKHAELGYWIGVPFWGNGYCTEGAREVLKYGFGTLKLNRIHSGHFSNNPASGRILRKLGMKHEGTSRRHILKWGEYLDVELYGLLASEYVWPVDRRKGWISVPFWLLLCNQAFIKSLAITSELLYFQLAMQEDDKNADDIAASERARQRAKKVQKSPGAKKTKSN